MAALLVNLPMTRSITTICRLLTSLFVYWTAPNSGFQYKYRPLLQSEHCTLNSTSSSNTQSTCSSLDLESLIDKKCTRICVEGEWKTNKENPQCTRLGSNPNLPILVIQVQHESCALDHVATGAVIFFSVLAVALATPGHLGAPLGYSAPLAYGAPAVAAPLAYGAPAVAAPLAYGAHGLVAPLAYSAHIGRSVHYG
ncbi:unnamed protein product [Timema podura]|uniref:Uncharacterized protein n=1 Tax=Timema podura TaxID=61482 RepID=A0ABN7NWL6_TIMPD|nr:unnamed protein product [Timema podura]